MGLLRKDEGGLPVNRKRQSQPTAPKEPRQILRKLGRIGRRTAEVAVLLAALAGLVVLGRWTHTYVTTSDHFAADVAEVSGNDRVPVGVIQHMSGLTVGTNIFTVSPDEAARRIVEHPWIATAKVRRRLPSHVIIEVVEREAVALLRVDNLYLIDAEGTLFKRFGPGDPVDLPIITGVDRDRYREDNPGARVDLSEALALMRLYEESGLASSHPISEIHLEHDGALSLYTEGGGTHILLGRPPFRRKIRRLSRLFRELRSRQAVADYVYLEQSDDHVQPDRAVVRLRVN